jgi:UDP-N-acetylglucosamine diphosphorylase/glucosamine-1-phosphate N-acetyltransferase
MSAALILFDDRRAREWAPFALTRPIGELIFGAMRLVERAERASGVECLGHLTAPHLARLREPGARSVLAEGDVPDDQARVYWCARAAPAPGQRIPTSHGPALYTIAGRPVGCLLPAGHRPDPGLLESLEPDSSFDRTIEVEGRLLDWIWEAMIETPDWAARDLAAADGPPAADPLPDGVYTLGDHDLRIAADVRIEPPTLFDLRAGPIRIDEGVEIRSGTRLAGPAAIGPRSRLLGGSFESVVTGPFAYLRGEIGHAIVLGYVNKAHDGYLGHAYVGRWVNLGAFTTNSDLKNNYHPVRVWTPSGEQDTGELKIGCFLGDHVKTGIGMLLNTGTVVGAGSNLYGSIMPPKHVPPFSWGEGADLTEHRLDAFLDTAARTMRRRGIELDDDGRAYLESCWSKGRETPKGRARS